MSADVEITIKGTEPNFPTTLIVSHADTMSNAASSSRVNTEGVMLFEQPFARVSEMCFVSFSTLIHLYGGRFRSRTTGRSSGRPNDK